MFSIMLVSWFTFLLFLSKQEYLTFLHVSVMPNVSLQQKQKKIIYVSETNAPKIFNSQYSFIEILSIFKSRSKVKVIHFICL